MPKRLLKSMLFLLFVMLSPTAVFACSFLPPTVIIDCGAGNMIYLRTNRTWHPITDVELVEQEIQAAIVELDKLTSNCGAENIAELKSWFEPYFRRWLNRELGFESYLRIELYSIHRTIEIRERQNELTSCWYQLFAQEGNWLFITDHQRDYCSGGGCAGPIISPTAFFGYVLTHFRLDTLPYFVGYVVAAGSIILAWIAFIRQPIGRSRKLIQLLLLGCILFILACLSFTVLGPVILEIPIWAVIFLVTALVIRAYRQRKSKVEITETT